MRIELIELDMSKAREHEHPDISADKEYLILYDDDLFVGTFNRVWFGWNFNGWHAPLQLDEPGTNKSDWQQIWEIKRVA